MEYLEENFKLLPEEQVGLIPGTKPQTGEIVTQEEACTGHTATWPSATDTDVEQPIGGDAGDSEIDKNRDDNDVEQDTEEDQPHARRKIFNPAKPGLIERFAKAHGYTQDGSDRFYASDGGWIEKVSVPTPFHGSDVPPMGTLAMLLGKGSLHHPRAITDRSGSVGTVRQSPC